MALGKDGRRRLRERDGRSVLNQHPFVQVHGPLHEQEPPEQSIVHEWAPPQSALQEPPGQWNVQSAPFSHLYEQLPPLQVVSHVPPAQVQSFPEQVSCWFEELQAAMRRAMKSNVRIMNDPVRATRRGVTGIR